ncbi:MAG TPA: 1-deoxy-D-xylulose-5-phosphate reductoisomerase, partial [Gammaproteobacteria bacterium]|nr:1-deoxy-D-xylulose-5-phosphate reductoisomerase [Gammaproteobacteria bacterium]
MDAGVAQLDLCALARLDFEAPDLERFPCLRLAMQAADFGGGAAAVLNAANEIAVSAFLEGQIGFTAIAEVVERTLDGLPSSAPDDLEAVLDCDREARRFAQDAIKQGITA